MYPKDWPKCPKCREPALDGHITCGKRECDEQFQRRARGFPDLSLADLEALELRHGKLTPR